MLKDNGETAPRFIHKENQAKVASMFRNYASQRLVSKASEKNIAVSEAQRNAIERIYVTTDILDAVDKYKAQRLKAGDPLTSEQRNFMVVNLSLALGGYLPSQSRSIPLEIFTPIIYVSPVFDNAIAVLNPREIGITMKHEVEHVVDDVLGIYMGPPKGDKSSAAAMLWQAIKDDFAEHEVNAREIEKNK